MSRLHTIGGIDSSTMIWLGTIEGFYFHFTNITKRYRRKLTLKNGEPSHNIDNIEIMNEYKGLTFDEIIKKYRQDGFGE